MADQETGLPRSTRIIYALFDHLPGYNGRLLAGAGLLLLAVIAASGFFVVKKEEQAVVTRFGAVVRPAVGPGLHYSLPLVEQVRKRAVKRILASPITSSSEFTILSGDANLLDVGVTAQYRIVDLRKYLYESDAPEALLVALIREHVVRFMSGHFVDLIFTVNRDSLQNTLAAGINDDLARHDIGLALLAITIDDLQAVREARPAFRDVVDAIAERNQAVSRAEQKRHHIVTRSKGQAASVRQYAVIRSRTRLVQARAGVSAFQDLMEAYRQEPAQVVVTRYWDRMREIFRDATLSAVQPNGMSSIDINMVDSFDGRMPQVALDEGKLPRSLSRPFGKAGGERIEDATSEKHAVEGRSHDRNIERHHFSLADPRSLLFDKPGMFRHVDGARKGSLPPQRSAVDVDVTSGSGKKAKSGARSPDGAKEPKSGEKAGADAPKPEKKADRKAGKEKPKSDEKAGKDAPEPHRQAGGDGAGMKAAGPAHAAGSGGAGR